MLESHGKNVYWAKNVCQKSFFNVTLLKFSWQYLVLHGLLEHQKLCHVRYSDKYRLEHQVFESPLCIFIIFASRPTLPLFNLLSPDRKLISFLRNWNENWEITWWSVCLGPMQKESLLGNGAIGAMFSSVVTAVRISSFIVTPPWKINLWICIKLIIKAKHLINIIWGSTTQTKSV